MVDKNLVIIRTDGGICSQIAFAALGKYFEDKGCKVKYETDWFKEWGKGTDGRLIMNYDMPKAFPNINSEIASDNEIKYTKENYTLTKTISECDSLAYINGYPPEREISLIKYKDYFKEHFNPIDKILVADIEKNILSGVSCGVHVRRGDLSVYNSAYGYPTPVEYYVKAIKIIHGLSPDVKFFFFSDECDWIRQEIVPKIDFNINYKICDKNGTDKGYLDLYLMTKCDYLISSSGSLARFAKILSDKNPLLIMDRYRSPFVENFENVIILNDTILINAKNKHQEYVYVNNNKIKNKQKQTFAQKLFSIKNSEDKKHKVVSLLGIKIKFRKAQTLARVGRE